MLPEAEPHEATGCPTGVATRRRGAANRAPLVGAAPANRRECRPPWRPEPALRLPAADLPPWLKRPETAETVETVAAVR